MTEVLKITKPSFNVLTETNAFNFVLTTDYPTYKVAFDGSHTFTMNAGQFDASYTITHNLGYVPMVMGWLERSGKTYPCNSLTGISDVMVGGNPASVFAYCFADTTTVKIGAYNKLPVDGPADSNYTFTAHWKIFVDQY